MLTNFSQKKGKKTFINDSECLSMAAFFACYADEVQCADYSVFGFHRAAYPEHVETRPDFKGSKAEADLIEMNSKLKQAFEAKVDVAAFEAGKGVKVADIFSMKGRPLVKLNAKEAVKYGLVSKGGIIQVTPEKKAIALAMLECSKREPVYSYSELERAAANMAATAGPAAPQPKQTTTNKMDISTLKNEHPAVYAEAIKLGRQEERDCAGAWMVFADVDIEAVKKGIESGVPPSAKQMAEFSRKQFSAASAAKVEGEAAPAAATAAVSQPATPEAAKAAAEKAKVFADWESQVDASLKLKATTA